MKILSTAMRAGLLLGVTAWTWAQAPDLEHMDLVLRSVPDGPVAKVDGLNIGKEEFINAYRKEIVELMARLRTPQISDRMRVDTGLATLRRLIQNEIVYREAVKRTLTVSDKAVQEQWAKMLDGLKKAMVHSQGKSGSVETISEEDILKEAGLSREQAMADVRRGLVIKAMRDQIAKDHNVTVTEDEIAKSFEEHKDAFKRPEKLHLQQVFINTRDKNGPFDEKKKAQARERIENALKRIQAGESFDAVAQSMSEAPDKGKGGDMGTLPGPALPPFFVEPAASMQPGETSNVLESELGFHLFKLLEKFPGGEGTLDKAAPRIRQVLLAQKTDQAVGEFCKPVLDAPGRVEVYLQLEKTLATYPGYKEFKEQQLKEEKKSGKAIPSKPKEDKTKKKESSKKPGTKQ
jgi:parvulin-like peptidyl-prolyl isomerase